MEKVITLAATPSAPIELSEPGRYVIELAQPGCEVELHAVFDVMGTEQVRLDVIIHHQAPHTRANTTLKGVVRDQGFLRLAGRIIIDENCGDTNSFLTERILLLSDQAKAEAVPDLEIASDDVKCSHAASISSIPPEHLFYLMSRGIPRAQAEQLVVEGFLS